MPIILVTQETEIRRKEVGGQPRKIAQETLSQKYPTQERAGGVAQASKLRLMKEKIYQVCNHSV
jgi:hypothetical protein